MPVGTGAVTLSNLPSSPYVTDPNLFNQMTEKNIATARSIAAPTPGGFTSAQLLQVGIVSKLLLNLKGTLTVGTASATTGNNWPYNLLSNFQLNANGQNDLFNCSGLDLHVLKYARYPAYRDAVDLFPGNVGGGDAVAPGDYEINLTWEVPIAMDDVSLVGALYAQSSQTNISVRLQQATMDQLFSAIGGTVSFSGQYSVQETYFEIPYDSQGQIVIPDLSRLHGFNVIETPITAAGEPRIPLIRSAGQLCRLIVSGQASPTNRLSPAANAATTKKWEALRLEYGGNQRPMTFDPIELLLALNNQHYGSTPPYDRVLVDLVRENPPRDILLMQGVTELALVPRVGNGVTVTSGGSFRVVQESLY